jgi:hypothetical protein
LSEHSIVFQEDHHGAIAAKRALLNLKKHEGSYFKKDIGDDKFCKRIFSFSLELVRDGIIGIDLYEYKCKKCPKMYRDRSSFDYHLRTSHK